MKKTIFKSRAFPADALSAACIGILTACFLFGREEKTPEDITEAYPKMIDESDQLVTIDFTPEPEKLQPEPPKSPVAEADATDPDQPPAYTPEELEPEPSASPAQRDTPTAGASNGNGAVYDPVFGWVVPGEANQIPMDSAGDPDKMVGNM